MRIDLIASKIKGYLNNFLEVFILFKEQSF